MIVQFAHPTTNETIEIEVDSMNIDELQELSDSGKIFLKKKSKLQWMVPLMSSFHHSKKYPSQTTHSNLPKLSTGGSLNVNQ
jgi:hypothetical protein